MNDAGYVLCPATITGPVLGPHALALGLRPNMPCGVRCPVVRLVEGAPMAFECGRGHRFFAESKDVRTQPDELREAVNLLREYVDATDDCAYSLGDCQTHGTYGRPCVVERMRAYLGKLGH